MYFLVVAFNMDNETLSENVLFQEFTKIIESLRNRPSIALIYSFPYIWLSYNM